MSKKKDIYRMCCDEIINICNLFPGWSIARFISDEGIDITNPSALHSGLKGYREQLEMDNRVVTNDIETEEIVREGMRIHSLLIKQQMYGED